MASAPVLEIDRLLAPIAGENQAGTKPPFDLLRQLDEARKEGDPFGPPRKQDWPLIVQLTTNALMNTSKDMLVAARLTEGITQSKGFAGLRDAIIFLTRLLSECWDRLHPYPEDGEGPDVRGGPLLWLNDTTRGAKFPTTVVNVPLVEVRGERFTHIDWRGGRRVEFEAALSGVNAATIINLNEDLKAVRTELEKLSKVVDEKMPELGINLLSGPGTLGTAVSDVTESLVDLMKKMGIGEGGAAGDGDAAAGDDSAASGGTAVASKTAGATRVDLYRQLDNIADALQRIEPHSPIPFLVKRAVRLGALPFPQLMRAMIEESRAIDQLDKLLGIEADK
jgi:type VI secretion system protein ImpA